MKQLLNGLASYLPISRSIPIALEKSHTTNTPIANVCQHFKINYKTDCCVVIVPYLIVCVVMMRYIVLNKANTKGPSVLHLISPF